MTKIKVESKKQDPAGFTHLILSKPKEYRYKPGQYTYLALSENDKKTLAYASHESEPHLYFLFRGDYTHSTTPTLSKPQGAGFTCVFDNNTPMLFITHGTGITALRGAMVERKIHNLLKKDTLLYGSPSKDSEPSLDCLSANFGINQLRAYSQDPKNLHIQDVLQTLDVKNFESILLIGSGSMTKTCKEILITKNFPIEKIYTNF
ncbi:MAG: hypothetical protein LDLANPLL_01175 [Turneriella sp.]|nr:hypothetical protein [Turneriella sp.]